MAKIKTYYRPGNIPGLPDTSNITDPQLRLFLDRIRQSFSELAVNVKDLRNQVNTDRVASDLFQNKIFNSSLNNSIKAYADKNIVPAPVNKENKESDLQGISIYPKNITVNLQNGNVAKLEVFYSPFDIKDSKKGVTWSSSDPDIASVDEYGNVTLYQTGECIITATSTQDKDIYDIATLTAINETYLTAPYAWCAVDGSGEMVYTGERSPASGDAIWDSVDVTIPEGTVNSHLVSGGINAEYVRFFGLIHPYGYCNECHYGSFFWRNPEKDNPEVWIVNTVMKCTPLNIPEGKTGYQELYVNIPDDYMPKPIGHHIGCGRNIKHLGFLYKDALPEGETVTKESIAPFEADKMLIGETQWLATNPDWYNTGYVYNGHRLYYVTSWQTREGTWSDGVFTPTNDTWVSHEIYGYAYAVETFQMWAGDDVPSEYEYETWVRAETYPQGISIYSRLDDWDYGARGGPDASTLRPLSASSKHGIVSKSPESRVTLAQHANVFEYGGVVFAPLSGSDNWGYVVYNGALAWTASNCGKTIPQVSGYNNCGNATFNNATKYTYPNYNDFEKLGYFNAEISINKDTLRGTHWSSSGGQGTGFYEMGTGTAKIIDNNGKEYWFSHKEDIEETAETTAVIDEEFE